MQDDFKIGGAGPLPHPATQRYRTLWVAGWGSGPVPVPREWKDARRAPPC
jgi:hypothetical protein